MKHVLLVLVAFLLIPACGGDSSSPNYSGNYTRTVNDAYDYCSNGMSGYVYGGTVNNQVKHEGDSLRIYKLGVASPDTLLFEGSITSDGAFTVESKPYYNDYGRGVSKMSGAFSNNGWYGDYNYTFENYDGFTCWWDTKFSGSKM